MQNEFDSPDESEWDEEEPYYDWDDPDWREDWDDEVRIKMAAFPVGGDLVYYPPKEKKYDKQS